MELTNSSHNHPNPSDEGKAERFLRLITPIQGRLFAYVLSRWPNRTDAEDIHQDTVSTIWSKFDEYEPGTDFQAWAFTIARFRLMSFRKKNIRHPLNFNEDTLQVLEDKSEAFLNGLDTRIDTLQGCIKKLKPNDRTLLELKYTQELPVKRIATRFDVTPRAVYKILTRIHEVLMRCIRRTLAEEAACER